MSAFGSALVTPCIVDFGWRPIWEFHLQNKYYCHLSELQICQVQKFIGVIMLCTQPAVQEEHQRFSDHEFSTLQLPLTKDCLGCNQGLPKVFNCKQVQRELGIQ